MGETIVKRKNNDFEKNSLEKNILVAYQIR